MTTIERVPFLDVAAGVEAQRAEIDAAVTRVLDSGWFVMGPELEAFELRFAHASGRDHCIGVGNGLDALVLTLRAMDIGPGDEVIVPANTFIATWLAVTAVGATIVPVDVDPSNGLLDPALVESALTSRTRCVMPVHLYGLVVESAPLRDVVGDVPLVEDAAQAHLARDSSGTVAGAIGAAAAFSFYPGKNLGALGDGGAVVTGDAQLAARVRLLRNYGSRVKYVHEVAGVNSRLDELQAAVLLVRLAILEEGNARRREIVERYRVVIDGTSVRMPEPAPGSSPAWHLAPVWHAERDALRDHLADSGIDALIHYPAQPHQTDAYAAAFSGSTFPVAERIARETLSLPVGPHMTDAHVDRVCDALSSFVAAHDS